MRKAVQYFIKYSISADVLLLLIGVVGTMAILTISKSQFPRTESKNIAIETTLIGASPSEIEESITLKIENELKGTEGIKKITSTSSENRSVINIETTQNAAADEVLVDVKNAVDRINSFPNDAETPVIYKKERLDRAAEFMLSGKTDLKTLKSMSRLVEQELLALPEVSKVELSGFPEEEIEIAVRETDLIKYQLTFDAISRAVASANLEITGGKMEVNNTEITIRAKNKAYYAENLEDIIIKTSPNGTPILLKDVANVVDQWADDPSRSFFNGQPGVKFTVSSRLSEDIVETAGAVKDYIADFNDRKGVIKADLVLDGSVLIQQRTDLLIENGLIGIVLVLLVLGMFLKPRIAFWVALSIPISIAGMFIIAPYFGVNINMLSLFGLILVIGILVDDGVVIAENIFQKYEQGMPPQKAALQGVMEVMPSVVSAVITTCWFFALFFFVEGTLGDFMSNIGFVVIATLLFSLIEGFFILPAHIAHSKDLKSAEKPNMLERSVTGFFIFLKEKLYAPALRFSLENKTLVASICFVLLALSVNLVRGGYVSTTFFPYIDADDVVISLRLPPGTTEEVTESLLARIETATWEVNEEMKHQRKDKKDVIRFITRDINAKGSEGSLAISLLDGETRNTPSYEVTNAIQEKVGPIPQAESLTYGKPSVFGAAVKIGFVGNNTKEVRAAKDELKQTLEKIPALKDVSDNDKKGSKELNLVLTPKAEALGISLQTIIAQIRQGYLGEEVQRLQRGEDEVKVWVRYTPEERQSFTALENIKIRTQNKEYLLKDLAVLEPVDGVLNIDHVDGKTKLEVTAEQKDPKASTSAILADLKENVVPGILEKYPSVQVIYEGQSEQAAETSNSIQRTLPVILMLVFITVVLTFRSFKQAIIVFLLIPFAFIGVVFGHWLHDMQISMLSVFGILAVAGVVINDSLVLVGTMNRLLKEGKPFQQALYEASLSRFRPILLTSITTIAGLLPLVLETSLQAQFLIPMAISLAYGLAASTFIMLLLLPILLMASNGASRTAWWVWEGEWTDPESVEPAIKEEQEAHF